jgi:hypothetical protein
MNTNFVVAAGILPAVEPSILRGICLAVLRAGAPGCCRRPAGSSFDRASSHSAGKMPAARSTNTLRGGVSRASESRLCDLAGKLPHAAFCYVFTVAQIFNLSYRRFVIGRASDRSHAPWFPDVWQSATLRYSRLQVCATGVGNTLNRYRCRPLRQPGWPPPPERRLHTHSDERRLLLFLLLL